MLERTAPGRAGRPQHAHRELPRLPHRHHRQRAGRARRPAGQQVRGAACPSPTPVTGLTFDNALRRAAPRRRRDGHGQVPADRHRGRLPPAGRRGLRAVRGPRRLLRRDPDRGAAVPGVGGGGRRRRQLRRPGRRLPRRAGPQGVPRDPRRRPVQEHVRATWPGGSSRPPTSRCSATPRSGGCTATATSARSSSSTTRRARRGRCETPALFSFIGAVPRTDWLPPEIERDAKGFVRTGPALAQSAALDRPAAAVPAGDQPPRRVRRRGRAVRLGQARRLGRRRGGDGGPVRPRVPEGNVSPELPGVRTPARAAREEAT